MQIRIEHIDRTTGKPNGSWSCELPNPMFVSAPGGESEGLYNFTYDSVRLKLNTGGDYSNPQTWQFGAELRKLFSCAASTEVDVAIDIEVDDGKPIMVIGARV